MQIPKVEKGWKEAAVLLEHSQRRVEWVRTLDLNSVH